MVFSVVGPPRITTRLTKFADLGVVVVVVVITAGRLLRC